MDTFYGKLNKDHLSAKSILEDFPQVDSMKSLDEINLEKLLQLTLGVAMNCEQRQEVITRIT